MYIDMVSLSNVSRYGDISIYCCISLVYSCGYLSLFGRSHDPYWTVNNRTGQVCVCVCVRVVHTLLNDSFSPAIIIFCCTCKAASLSNTYSVRTYVTIIMHTLIYIHTCTELCYIHTTKNQLTSFSDSLSFSNFVTISTS